MPLKALKRSNAAPPIPAAPEAGFRPAPLEGRLEKDEPPDGASGTQTQDLPAPSFSAPTWRPGPQKESALAGKDETTIPTLIRIANMDALKEPKRSSTAETITIFGTPRLYPQS